MVLHDFLGSDCQYTRVIKSNTNTAIPGPSPGHYHKKKASARQRFEALPKFNQYLYAMSEDHLKASIPN